MKKFFLGLIAGAFCLGASAGESGVYAAHEWGTFTSVQGADGAQMEWNPFVPAELPNFVYNRSRPNNEGNGQDFAALLGKGAYLAKQRMETPVIYFYSPEKKTVDVRVDFPAGLMTEWYPYATDSDARLPIANEGARKKSFLEWKGLEIAPAAATAEQLPVEPGKSHYYAARQTEAAFLKMVNPARPAAELERFLFYRGIGNFEATLKVTTQEDGSRIVLQNTGKDELRHLLVLKVENGKAGKAYTLVPVEKLAAGLSERIDLAKGKTATRDELKATLEKSLEREGLFDAEAKAMVKTWEDSWLDETGLRVLYVLSNDRTCELLPLKITPEPQEIVRVMVGRAEIITPQVEIALERSINEYLKGDSMAREKAMAKTRALGLGRFQEAAIRRLLKKNPGEKFKGAAYEMANQLQRGPAAPPLALQ